MNEESAFFTSLSSRTYHIDVRGSAFEATINPATGQPFYHSGQSYRHCRIKSLSIISLNSQVDLSQIHEFLGGVIQLKSGTSLYSSIGNGYSGHVEFTTPGFSTVFRYDLQHVDSIVAEERKLAGCAPLLVLLCLILIATFITWTSCGTTISLTRANHERQATAGAAVSEEWHRSLSASGTAAAPLLSPRFSSARESVASFALAPAAPDASIALVQPATPPQRCLR